MPRFIVRFAPIDTTVYVYEVEAENETAAHYNALDDFRMDIGYDMSKDFECINVEEFTDA
tara:strand:+ start:645 stop:824 length:180 start_codon:yes stop_codon:yes gene_type:complete